MLMMCEEMALDCQWNMWHFGCSDCSPTVRCISTLELVSQCKKLAVCHIHNILEELPQLPRNCS